MNSSRSLFLCRQRNLALAKDNNRRDRNPLWATSGHCTTYSGKLRRSGDRLHLNSDAVDRFSGSVENPSEWLRRQVHDQTSLAIPILDRLHDISVRRQFSAIWSNIVHGPLHLVEHEQRWPSVMMDGLFVLWLQGYFKDAKPLVLE